MKTQTKSYFEKNGYSFNKEFCGYPEKRIVVRYMGEFIKSHKDEKDAVLTAIFHYDERNHKLL